MASSSLTNPSITSLEISTYFAATSARMERPAVVLRSADQGIHDVAHGDLLAVHEQGQVNGRPFILGGPAARNRRPSGRSPSPAGPRLYSEAWY